MPYVDKRIWNVTLFLNRAFFSACVYALSRSFFLGKIVLKSPLFFARFWRFLIKFTWLLYEDLNFVLEFCIQAVTFFFGQSDVKKRIFLSDFSIDCFFCLL